MFCFSGLAVAGKTQYYQNANFDMGMNAFSVFFPSLQVPLSTGRPSFFVIWSES